MKLLKEAFYIAKLDEIQVDVLIRNLNSGKQSGYYQVGPSKRDEVNKSIEMLIKQEQNI